VTSVSNPPAALPARPALRLSTRRAGSFALITAIAVAATSAATLHSAQLGCTVALVLLVTTTYVARPPLGMAVLIVVWIVAPAIRRILGLEAGVVSQDPLSVAPFVATGAVAAIAAWRSGVPRLVLWLAAAVVAGLAFGLPSASGHASAGLYSLFAYLSAFSMVLLGWHEGRLPVERWSPVRVLCVAAPLIGAYALYQYFVALPAWDRVWLDSVDFSSIGAPEAGKIRSFASLNSPGLLGVVLALAIVLYTGRAGLVRWTSAALIVTAAALSVTYVRSAWLSLAAAAVVLLLLSGRQAAPRVARLALLLTLMALALSVAGSTYTAVVERIATFGSLGQDDSAQARTATPSEVLPELVDLPLGHGLGSAGEATRLARTEGLKAPDNGYLAMAYQLGFAGALLVVGALIAAMAIALRRLYAARDPDRALIAALFVFLLVGLAGGDGFYGLAGVLLWYIAGAALGRSTAPTRRGA
jgi:putative inorganic carbon (hco3(-)) transporter